jgi:hypothetical protein
MSQYGEQPYGTTATEPTQIGSPYPGAAYAGQAWNQQPNNVQQPAYGAQGGYPYGGGPAQPGSPYGQPAGGPGRNRTKIIVIAVVAVLAIAGGAVGLVLGLSGGDKKSNVQTTPKPPVATSPSVPSDTKDVPPSDSSNSDSTTGDTPTGDTTTGSDTTGSDTTDPTTTTGASDLAACEAAIPAIQSIDDTATRSDLDVAATKVNAAAALAEDTDLRDNLQAIAGTYQDAADGNHPDTSKLYDEGYQVGQLCRAAGYTG